MDEQTINTTETPVEADTIMTNETVIIDKVAPEMVEETPVEITDEVAETTETDTLE